MTSQARPAAICSWLSVHVLFIESAVVQSRSCRLVAGMHSTSFVLGKEVGCLRSVFCALVSNIDRLLAREWCFLSAAFAVNSRHRTAAFTASLMLRRSSRRMRPPKLQVRSRRALAIPPPFPEQKEKNSSHTMTQWRWRSCEPQNDNRSYQLCGLRRSTCR